VQKQLIDEMTAAKTHRPALHVMAADVTRTCVNWSTVGKPGRNSVPFFTSSAIVKMSKAMKSMTRMLIIFIKESPGVGQ
jgi:hypothetical protein